MLDLSTPKGRIVDAALKAAAQAPWADVTLSDIARSAEVSLVDLRRSFGSKGEILAAFVRAVDDEVLARTPQRADTGNVRDALFEVIMSRFDVLEPYKPGLRSIADAWSSADGALLSAIASSQAWMLRAAGIEAEGLGGAARSLGLATVYSSVFRTWLHDDDPGLARTMAALDRRLRRGERALNGFEEVRSKLAGFATAFKAPHTRAKAEPAAPKSQPPASA